MTARSGTPPAEGTAEGRGATFPCCFPRCCSALAPQAGERFIDATFGAGGYSAALLDAAAGVRVLAIDRDPAAVAAGRPLPMQSGGRLTLVAGPLRRARPSGRGSRASHRPTASCSTSASRRCSSTIRRAASRSRPTGRSTCACREPGATAADVVNTAAEADIADILFQLGDERRSRAIARAIVARRRERPFTRTSELAEVVERVLGRGKIGGRHPATRTFQALRIYVNDELGELAQGLAAAERVLQARRAARRRHLPLAGGRHRQALPQGAGRQARSRARGTCRPAHRQSASPVSDSLTSGR